jgi:aryl-alcohol dehydrogenase-like predicted oxidoreductase
MNGKHYTNEALVGKALKIHGRDKFILCTKFGISATREVIKYV